MNWSALVRPGFVLAALSLMVVGEAAAQEASDKPNIILILADENYNPTALEQPKEKLTIKQLNALFAEMKKPQLNSQ